MGDRLSPRERDILRLLGAGRSTRQIADEIGIAESTVIWYAREVVRSVGMRRADELAHRLARQRERRTGPRRIALVALAIVGLLAAGAVAVAAMSRHDAPAPSPSAVATPSGSPGAADESTAPGRPSPVAPAQDAQSGATLAPMTAPAAPTSRPLATLVPPATLAPALPLGTPGGLPLPLPLATPHVP